VPAETRAAIGISDGLVRLSVGLESPRDLTADLDQALRAASSGAAKVGVQSEAGRRDACVATR